ncbi:MAG: NAD(P)-dependent oxidoreductase [Gammaproteobacteria bacterium]|nr:NAD(P)-dependent oxidoreductase [Gammaproteobacteria bacterium]
MQRVAFLGLGTMGYPMAGHLCKNGYHVTVYNRTLSKAEKWSAQYVGQVAKTPADAAEKAEIIFCCVGNDNDVRAMATGENGAFSAMQTEAVFVDHTTTSAKLARELEQEANKRGFGFIDAPVSGGQRGAEDGVLTVMAGGQSEIFERARPVIESYACAVRLMGPAGSGQLTKMVNQICIAGLLQGLSEGINFARNAGLDVERVLRVIDQGAAQSWQMENRGLSMAEGRFEFGFAVDWMRKDLGLCLDEADTNRTPLPITALIDQFYARIQQQGGGRWDTSSLIRLLE